MTGLYIGLGIAGLIAALAIWRTIWPKKIIDDDPEPFNKGKKGKK